MIPSECGYLYPEPLNHTLRLRYGYWRCKSERRGTVVLQAGRTECFEKYHETIETLLNKRFDVWSLDWRGQGLSTRLPSHYQPGYIDSYETYLRDFHYFVQTKLQTATAEPRVLLAHSMGGHLALRYLREHQGFFQACVLSAPMVDIVSAPFPRPLIWALAFAGSWMGHGQKYAPTQHDFNDEDRNFLTNRLTTDPLRFQRGVDVFDNQPELAVGGATFRWMKETLLSISQLRRREYASNIKTPVLILSSEDETVVDSKSHQEIAELMPFCQVVSIPECKHELLQENDAVQTIFWSEFDTFLNKWLFP